MYREPCFLTPVHRAISSCFQQSLPPLEVLPNFSPLPVLEETLVKGGADLLPLNFGASYDKFQVRDIYKIDIIKYGR